MLLGHQFQSTTVTLKSRGPGPDSLTWKNIVHVVRHWQNHQPGVTDCTD